MPQMAPLSWLNLFILFILMFLILSTMNYFSFSYSIKSSLSSKKVSLINWKW
uniref:ATP synthase F0 subunit 8 n=1 Tax=Agriotes fuscicollis TaxID=941251 RepID=UPI00200062EB|nr:ATP synthase F0 subunit 8 [Agriotes fuscicollis]UNQ87634.1 ATP synthase F0 subunit 8 [Agriotes fuscicollis]